MEGIEKIDKGKTGHGMRIVHFAARNMDLGVFKYLVGLDDKVLWQRD